MAEYTIVSDVSIHLLRTLREYLCPEPVQSPEAIKLASPADKNNDYQLGLFLYDLRELGEYRPSTQLRGADNRKTFPPRTLSLHYMLYLNGKAQIAAGAEAEQRILGRALQVLSDRPLVDMAAAHPFEGAPDASAAVTFLQLSFEEKCRIWSALSIPYQVGLYFSASPILLSSTRSEPFVRVTDAEFTLAQNGAGELPRRQRGP